MKKFLIVAMPYNEDCGGDIVLHKLCDQINRLDREAYVTPYVNNYEIGYNNILKPIEKFAKESLRNFFYYKTNPSLKTPLLSFKSFQKEDPNEWIVVYPEIIFGNPLSSKNTVRWFLHHPGYHSGKIFFGQDELYFRYHSGIKPYSSPSSTLSELILNVIHYPLEFYNDSGASPNRYGTAYCLRKGRGKVIEHDLSDSILIDGKSHREVSAIFKRVKQFISYDTYTAYSHFAVLSGCESIVIPDKGISEDEWMPNLINRQGLAYGFENLEKAKLTKHLLTDRIKRDQEKNLTTVAAFISESEKYFSR